MTYQKDNMSYTRLRLTAEELQIVKEKELLTLAEASAYLTLHPQTLYGYAVAGSVPCSRVGRKYVFRKSALDKWIEAKANKSAEAEAMQRARAASLRKQAIKIRH